MCTADAQASMMAMSILYDTATTDYMPVEMPIKFEYIPAISSDGNSFSTEKLACQPSQKKFILAVMPKLIKPSEIFSYLKMPFIAMM